MSSTESKAGLWPEAFVVEDAEEVNTVEVAAEDEDSDNEPEAIGHGGSVPGENR